MAERLSDKQLAFCREYVIDFDREEAYSRAGYRGAGDTRRVNATRLLKNALIVAEIERLKAVRDQAFAERHAEEMEKSRLRLVPLLNEIHTLAHSNLDHYRIVDGEVTLAPGAPPNAMQAVSSIRKKTKVHLDGTREYEVWITLWDKPGSVKMGCQHFGALTEKKEVTGKDGGPVEQVVVYLPQKGSIPPDGNDD
jgi:hypothetical protein